MNIDIFQILKLVFHLVEDTELKENKTFQIVKEVVNSIDGSPLAAGSKPPVEIHQPQAANSKLPSQR
ncbi:MAG: hypothetical protein WCP79_14475 [Bacillota bacterium]